jgi:uncharacterized protein (DUF433 family)
VIKGTRIGVEFVLDFLAGGDTPQQVRDPCERETIGSIRARSRLA